MNNEKGKNSGIIIAILAILKVGGAFLPIDISYPNDRIDYILRNSKAKILLTNLINKLKYFKY